MATVYVAYHVVVGFQHHFLIFFNDTATPEIYPLSLHDALPISTRRPSRSSRSRTSPRRSSAACTTPRSEEHTSELQSPNNIGCRLLLEKKHSSASAPAWPWLLGRVAGFCRSVSCG